MVALRVMVLGRSLRLSGGSGGSGGTQHGVGPEVEGPEIGPRSQASGTAGWGWGWKG